MPAHAAPTIISDPPTLKLLGDYWALRMISTLRKDALHYSELQRAIPGLNVATLTNRLKKLEAAGLLMRTERSRADVTYSLTALGGHALPIVDALTRFSASADLVRYNAAKARLQQKHDARRRVGYRIY